MIRNLVERLVRGRAFKRTLPNGVSLYVSADSQLKYLFSNFDTGLIAVANKLVNDESVVWDIGANCGVFAFSCNKAHKVVAVEADPFLLHTLQRSVALRPCNITLIGGAVSGEVGFAEFSIAARGRASNFLSRFGGRSQSGGVRSTLVMPTYTLDSMLEKFTSPTVVKIDVEGAEVEVLRGATRLIREVRPTWYIEIGRDVMEHCKDLLAPGNYDFVCEDGFNCIATPR